MNRQETIDALNSGWMIDYHNGLSTCYMIRMVDGHLMEQEKLQFRTYIKLLQDGLLVKVEDHGSNEYYGLRPAAVEQIAKLPKRMSLKDQLEVANRESSKEMAAQIASVLKTAVWIRDNMDRLIQRINTDGVEANINTLGEIQGLGHDLDRACAMFGAAREMKLARQNLLKEISFMESFDEEK